VTGRAVLVAAVLGATAAGAAAQGRWTLVGAAAAVRVTPLAGAHGEGFTLRGPRASVAAALHGRCRVDFAVEAVGKPASLELDVPAGADVALAVGPAAAASPRELAPGGDAWAEAGTGVRVAGDPGDRDYRVAARWQEPAGSVGLVARWRGAGDHYAFAVDRASGRARLERQIGGHRLQLAEVPVDAGTGALELAFQVEGFRLRAFVNDQLVLEALDGALGAGCFGVRHDGGQAPARVTVAPPCPERASSALVRPAGTAATLYVAGRLPPGHWAVVELRLDRPMPLLPRGEAGLEPWLLHAPVAPHVLFGDWAGPFALAQEVPVRGQMAVALQWPDLPLLRGQAALARLVLVEPDGSYATAASPAVGLRL
jgi:hypothetical protein